MDSLGVIPRNDSYFFEHESGEFTGSFTAPDFDLMPFGRVESWAVGETDLFVGTGDHFQIERRSPAGGLVALIRLCDARQPVQPEDMARAIEEYLAPHDERNRRKGLEALNGIQLPTLEPSHLEMHLDRAGRLWVRDFAPEWEERTWRVFDPDGRWIGSATLPVGTRILSIGEDRVLVAAVDPLGVETVRVHRLERR